MWWDQWSVRSNANGAPEPFVWIILCFKLKKKNVYSIYKTIHHIPIAKSVSVISTSNFVYYAPKFSMGLKPSQNQFKNDKDMSAEHWLH